MSQYWYTVSENDPYIYIPVQVTVCCGNPWPDTVTGFFCLWCFCQVLMFQVWVDEGLASGMICFSDCECDQYAGSLCTVYDYPD